MSDINLNVSFKTDVIAKLDDLSKKIDAVSSKNSNEEIKTLIDGYTEEIKKSIEVFQNDIISEFDSRIEKLSDLVNEAIKSISEGEKPQKAKKDPKEKTK